MIFSNISTEAKEAAIVFATVVAVVYIFTPKSARSLVPKPAKATKAEFAQKENAMIALDAYMTAVENGEKPTALNALNQELGKTYGLRVYKTPKGYVARDSKGTDILYAK